MSIHFKYLSIPLLAVMLSTTVPFAAHAADTPAPAVKTDKTAKTGDAAKHPDMAKEGKSFRKGPRGPHIDDADLDKIEKMNTAERKAYFKSQREAFEKLSDEEKRAAIEKRKAWYDGLSQEKKDALKARREALFDKIRAEKKAEFDAMSPEEQKAVKEKWEKRREEFKARHGDKGPGDHKPGGHGPKAGPKDGDIPPPPPEDAPAE